MKGDFALNMNNKRPPPVPLPKSHSVAAASSYSPSSSSPARRRRRHTRFVRFCKKKKVSQVSGEISIFKIQNFRSNGSIFRCSLTRQCSLVSASTTLQVKKKRSFAHYSSKLCYCFSQAALQASTPTTAGVPPSSPLRQKIEI